MPCLRSTRAKGHTTRRKAKTPRRRNLRFLPVEMKADKSPEVPDRFIQKRRMVVGDIALPRRQDPSLKNESVTLPCARFMKLPHRPQIWPMITPIEALSSMTSGGIFFTRLKTSTVIAPPMIPP